jgi:hypothetical protein
LTVVVVADGVISARSLQDLDFVDPEETHVVPWSIFGSAPRAYA